jgi:Sigma-70, region 4
VRRLRGCLDGLPAAQRNTLVLRYGVGPVRRRSRDEAARLLDVSLGRVRLLERRAVRGLAEAGRSTGCEGTGISAGMLEGLPASFAAGAGVAGALTAALEEGGSGAVAGVRQAGGEARDDALEPEGDEGPAASAGPSLGNPFGSAGPALDNPIFLMLLAIVAACLASAAREIRRAVR